MLNPYQQVIKTLAEDTKGDLNLLKIAATDLVDNVLGYLENPIGECIVDSDGCLKDNEGDAEIDFGIDIPLADQIEIRCIESLRGLGGDGLCDLADILLGEDDVDVVQLRNQIQ